jgi:retron-type reverse transcriptase
MERSRIPRIGFSYGFRLQRSPHLALDALTVVIMTKRVNWVLDADIRSFFGTLQHEWLVRFIEHRVGDRCVVAYPEMVERVGAGRRAPHHQ